MAAIRDARPAYQPAGSVLGWESLAALANLICAASDTSDAHLSQRQQYLRP